MKNRLKNIIQKTRYSYRSLPDKKQYVEFFTAVLTVPVLLTVILLNMNNLKNVGKAEEKNPEPTPVREVIYVSPKNSGLIQSSRVEAAETNTPYPTQSEACKKELGPVEIRTPQEGEMIKDNPVTVIVDYKSGEYCAAVWSYRINGGKWSEYDDKSFALYNLPAGTIILEIKVKSIVNGSEKQLKRTFTYEPAVDSSVRTASASAN
jgi:hypothetical protein